MAFELHVWSPAFELPSIDPQCLAAIAYLSCISQGLDTQFQWQIIASNDPSISPTKELPALKDPSTSTTIGGLQNIIAHLRPQNPRWDLDQESSTSSDLRTADNTAFSTHIITRGNILLSLSLFVSTENYTTTTRPTYSSILPWPTQYIVPPALRSKARDLTAHLGLTSPDLDANNDDENESKNKSIIPDSLRTFRSTTNSPQKSLTESLSQQTTTLFRLESLIDDFCDPLSSLLTSHPPTNPSKPYLLSPDHPTTTDVLATAYLSLMLHPSNLPQNWLQTRLRTRWPDLVDYAQRSAFEFWGSAAAAANELSATAAKDKASTSNLPWGNPPQQNLLWTTATAIASTLPTTTSNILNPASTNPSKSTTDNIAEPSDSPPSNEQPHSLPTILLASTALASAVAALSTFLLVPYLSSDAEGGARGGGDGGGRRRLSEMGEAGGILAGVVGGGRPGVGAEVDVSVGERGL